MWYVVKSRRVNIIEFGCLYCRSKKINRMCATKSLLFSPKYMYHASGMNVSILKCIQLFFNINAFFA